MVNKETFHPVAPDSVSMPVGKQIELFVQSVVLVSNDGFSHLAAHIQQMVHSVEETTSLLTSCLDSFSWGI